MEIKNEHTLQLEALINQDSFSPDKAMELVRLGADKNAQNSKGVYFLKLLVQNRHHEATQELVEQYDANIALAFNLPADYQKELAELNPTQKMLGKGSNSTVYRGTYDQKNIAVKYAHFAPESYAKSLDSFVIEIQNLITLKSEKSDNIIDIVGFNIEIPKTLSSFSYHLALEEIPGCSLDDLIMRPTECAHMMDEFRLIRTRAGIIDETTKGLSVIHKHFVHADIKPSNILVTPTFKVKIIDYEYAREEGYKGFENIRGTSLYKAPEVLCLKTNTKKSDIFSWSVTSFEIMNIAPLKYPFYAEDSEKALHDYLQTGHRAHLSEKECSFKMAMIISVSWDTNEDKRPTAQELTHLLSLTDDEVYKLLKLTLRNPLALACKYARLDLVRELVNEKNIHELSEEGATPLLAASASSLTHNNQELFELLLKMGADIFALNAQGKSALDALFENNNESGIKVLLPFALSLTLLKKPIMSLKTIKLAEEWVAKNQKEALFTTSFFEQLRDMDAALLKSNQALIANATNKTELFSAINQIGFFPSANQMVDKKCALFKVSEFIKGVCKEDSIYRAYGLREKAIFLFKENNTFNMSADARIANANTKEQLLEVIDAIKFFKTSAGLVEASKIKSAVEDYFNNKDSLCCITRAYGLRDKALLIKETLEPKVPDSESQKLI